MKTTSRGEKRRGREESVRQAVGERRGRQRKTARAVIIKSLTHSYCSGYSTELRGMQLMYDSSRTITFLQTRIRLIICERGDRSLQSYAEKELNFQRLPPNDVQFCFNLLFSITARCSGQVWLFLLVFQRHLIPFSVNSWAWFQDLLIFRKAIISHLCQFLLNVSALDYKSYCNDNANFYIDI